jgi:hypothetical protein
MNGKTFDIEIGGTSKIIDFKFKSVQDAVSINCGLDGSGIDFCG